MMSRPAAKSKLTLNESKLTLKLNSLFKRFILVEPLLLVEQ